MHIYIYIHVSIYIYISVYISICILYMKICRCFRSLQAIALSECTARTRATGWSWPRLATRLGEFITMSDTQMGFCFSVG